MTLEPGVQEVRLRRLQVRQLLLGRTVPEVVRLLSVRVPPEGTPRSLFAPESKDVDVIAFVSSVDR